MMCKVCNRLKCSRGEKTGIEDLVTVGSSCADSATATNSRMDWKWKTRRGDGQRKGRRRGRRWLELRLCMECMGMTVSESLSPELTVWMPSTQLLNPFLAMESKMIKMIEMKLLSLPFPSHLPSPPALEQGDTPKGAAASNLLYPHILPQHQNAKPMLSRKTHPRLLQRSPKLQLKSRLTRPQILPYRSLPLATLHCPRKLPNVSNA